MIPIPPSTNGELPVILIAEIQLSPDLTQLTAERREPTPLERAASVRLEAALRLLNPEIL